MVFDSRHKLLTVHGKLWKNSGAPEEWTFGIRFQNSTTTAVSQAQANAAHTAVATWWQDTTNGPVIYQEHQFNYVKLAPVGVDGKYPPGEISYESTAVTLSGLGTTIQVWPGQSALAVTLITSKPGARGRASKGRIYLPPLATTIGTDGRVTAATATRVSTGVANLLGALNDVPELGQAAVYSAVGVGDHYPITQVRTGTVVDTIRRRRRQQPENPTPAVAVP